MVTRYQTRKGTEGEDQEEMEEIEEMIGELFEEDPQEDQPENPTIPEPEVEGTVGDQPSKSTQKEELSLQDIMNFIAETSRKTKEETREPVSYTHLDGYKIQTVHR